MADIKVKDLASTSSISVNASFLALTDSANNEVQLITKSNLINTLISSDVNNGLNNNDGLYVPKIGNLSDLDTTNKSSIVNAINENYNSIITRKQPVMPLSTTGTITLTDNSVNSITPTGTITFELPEITDNTIFHEILVQAKLNNTVYIAPSRLGVSYYFAGQAPSFDVTGLYNIYFEYDSIQQVWVCGVLYKGAIN